MRVNGGIIYPDDGVRFQLDHIVRAMYDELYSLCTENLEHNRTTDDFDFRITLKKDGSIELVNRDVPNIYSTRV